MSSPDVAADLPAVSREAVDVRISVALDGNSIVGRLVGPSGAETAFDGYVELIAAIERLLERSDRATPDRPPGA